MRRHGNESLAGSAEGDCCCAARGKLKLSVPEMRVHLVLRWRAVMQATPRANFPPSQRLALAALTAVSLIQFSVRDRLQTLLVSDDPRPRGTAICWLRWIQLTNTRIHLLFWRDSDAIACCFGSRYAFITARVDLLMLFHRSTSLQLLTCSIPVVTHHQHEHRFRNTHCKSSPAFNAPFTSFFVTSKLVFIAPGSFKLRRRSNATKLLTCAQHQCQPRATL